MSALAIVALIIWVSGTLLTAIVAAVTYADSTHPEEKQFTARLFFLSPLWPLLAVKVIGRMARDATGEQR